MADVAEVSGLALVFCYQNLVCLALFKQFTFDDLAEARCTKIQIIAGFIRNQQGFELDRLTDFQVQFLDLNCLAFFNLILLASGLDYCNLCHIVCISSRTSAKIGPVLL